MKKQTAQHLIIFIILLGIWWVIGYLVIMCTRLFLYPTRTPPFAFCIIVGLTTFMITGHHTNLFKQKGDYPVSTTNDLGYEYEIEDNKLTFCIPPTKEDGIKVCFNELAPHELQFKPLTVIGNIDGNNKTFYISTENTNHELFKEHGYYLRICRGENPNKLGSGFPYKRKYYYENPQLWDLYLPMFSIFCIIGSHLIAVAQSTTEERRHASN